MSTIDRKALARALAKATAYADCGRQQQAEEWARELVRLLGCHGILKPEGLAEVFGTTEQLQRIRIDGPTLRRAARNGGAS